MVPSAGIEPAARCLRGSCSDQYELKRHEKSAPARMGKDARGIWLLVPVSIMLTLETAFVGFIPAARRLIVALQAKNIIADVGNVEAQAAVDFSVVNGTKPFFKLHIITNAEFHAF